MSTPNLTRCYIHLASLLSPMPNCPAILVFYALSCSLRDEAIAEDPNMPLPGVFILAVLGGVEIQPVPDVGT